MDTTTPTGDSKVLVQGGGIGGMALAIRLADLGIAAEIVEADPNWRVYGAGISITGPTFRALKRLGVLDQVKAEGFNISHGAIICAPDGRRVADIPMRAIEPGLPTAGGILRPVLHEILSAKVKSLDISVRLGATVETLEDTPDGVRVTLSDGEAVDASLVIAADGAFSQMRARLFPQADQPVYTGQYCWRILASRPEEVDRPFFFMGHNITAGLMPVSPGQMYMWLLETVPDRRRVSDDALATRLLDLLAPFSGPMDAIKDAIGQGMQIICRPLDALLLPLPWHKGRTALIGDAVHATTPHLASGAGIAIEDGLVLAELIADGGDPEGIFQRFEQRRWERCRLVVEDSVAIGRMQQTEASPQALNARMHAAQAALAFDI